MGGEDFQDFQDFQDLMLTRDSPRGGGGGAEDFQDFRNFQDYLDIFCYHNALGLEGEWVRIFRIFRMIILFNP